MTRTATSPILHLIRRVVEAYALKDLADQELLRRFLTDHDKEAFNALLRRHGSMVLDVCRNVLGNEQDAEDAFQATFLVLAQKAGAIRKSASVGSWLYGVAYRTASPRLPHRNRDANERIRHTDPGKRLIQFDLHQPEGTKCSSTARSYQPTPSGARECPVGQGRPKVRSRWVSGPEHPRRQR